MSRGSADLLPAGATNRVDIRLAGPAGAAWLSCGLVLRQSPQTALAVTAFLGVAGAIALLVRRHTSSAVAAALLCATAATAAAGVRITAVHGGLLPRLAAAGAAVRVELSVTGDPELHPARVRGSALGRDLVVLAARAERLVWRGSGVKIRSPVVVLASGAGWTGLLPSQRVEAIGRLAPARRGELVSGVLLARGPPRILSAPSQVQRMAGRLRAGLRSASAGLPADTAGLLPGLVVGDTSRLPPALREDFRTTGMTHLVAVSGANVAILLGAALVVARRLGCGPRAGPAVAGLALAAFVVVARPSPSVLRAAAMGLVVVLALATGRGRAALPALCAAVLGLLLVEPALSRSIGFALSVTATAGLLVLAPPLRDRFARRLPGWLAEGLAVALAAQVACAPLIAAVFAQVSMVAVPANLLAAPAVVPATLLGVLTAVTAPWCAPLGRLLAQLAGVPTGFIVAVAHHGARLPASSLPWPTGGVGAGLLVAASVAAVLLMSAAAGRRLLAVGVVSALAALVVARTLAPGWPPPGWQLVACDVGQGDALVLSAGRGTAVVVDAGPDPTRMDRCLRSLRVRSVPLVVLTHLHADHVEGLPAVLRYGVQEVEVGPLDEPVEEQARVAGWVRRAGARLTRVVDGEARALGSLRWHVLAPSHPFLGTDSDPNNSSIVLRVQLVGFTALLTGDVEPPAQAALLDSGADLRSDVLKVPHHGSDHQEPAFLGAAASALALTSVGAGNTYGHPSQRTLQRLADDGARSYRTDRDGAVALLSQHGAVVAVGRRGSGTPPARPQIGAARPAGAPATSADVLAARRPGSRAVDGTAAWWSVRPPRPVLDAPNPDRTVLLPAARAPPPVGDWADVDGWRPRDARHRGRRALGRPRRRRGDRCRPGGGS